MTEVSREDVVLAAKEAYAEQGYEYHSELHEFIFDIVKELVVKNKKERATVPMDRDTLMSQCFPLVPGPDEWSEQDEPVMAKAVWKELRSRVWSVVRINGPVQTMLGERNGHMLCRVGGPRSTVGVYITQDKECMKLDYWDHLRDARVEQATKDGKFTAEQIRRMPQHEEWIAAMFDDQLRAVLTEGRTHVRLLMSGDDKK